MLQLNEKLDSAVRIDGHLTLPFDLRQKSRLRARLDDGEDVGVLMPRGTVLRDGDLLRASDGRVVSVSAAPETVSLVHCADPLLLARACYHLGNRHVPLQIEQGSLRYLHDHVLDDMLRALGLEVACEQLPFEPEAGAYHSHGAHHGHPHEH